MAKFDLLTTLTLNAAGFTDGINKAKKETQEMATAIKDGSSDVANGINSLTDGATAGFTNLISKIMAVSTPLAAVGVGVSLLASPFVAFFTSSQEGMNMLAVTVSEFKADIQVLKGYLIDVGKTMATNLGGNEKVNKFFGDLGTGMGRFINLVTMNFFPTMNRITGVSKVLETLGSKMSEAELAAKKYTDAQQKEEVEEIGLISKRAESNKLLVEARAKYAEASGTIDERIDLLKKAQAQEASTAAEEIALATQEWQTVHDFNLQKDKDHQLLNEDRKREAEALAKIDELQTASDQRSLRAKRELAALRKKELDDAKALVKAYAPTEEAIGDIAPSAKSSLNVGSKAEMKLAYDSMEAMKERAIKGNKALEKENKALEKSYTPLKAATEDFKRSQENLDNTLLHGANSWKDYVNNIKSAIKDLIGSLIAKGVATMVSSALEVAGASGPFALFVAPALTALAAGIARTAFNSLIPNFATGGIVGGYSFTGDKVPAMVNSGEMILNSGQQNNLFKMLNSGAAGGGTVEFKIKGNTLVGVLNNNSRQINSYN